MAAPLGPFDNEEVHSTRPTLVVRNIDDDLSNDYQFELSEDEGFGSLVATQTVAQEDGSTTSWTVPTELEAGQTYFWRTRANSFDFGPALSFSVVPQTYAYPNPYYVQLDGDVTFTQLPFGANLTLMTPSGEIVRRWTNVADDMLTWDGRNESGNLVSSGTYLWFVEDTDANGKLVVIR